jgi:hypothetical protein
MKTEPQRETEAVEAAAEGSARRRTLIFSMRQALRAQPAFLVRGSSRRIMTMRIPRPADIRVINRRDDRLDRSLQGFTFPLRKKRKPPPRKSCLKCSSISENGKLFRLKQEKWCPRVGTTGLAVVRHSLRHRAIPVSYYGINPAAVDSYIAHL